MPQGATGTSFQANYDYTSNTNRITTSPFSYTSTSDPNAKTGNMTADNNHTYSWDTDGHVTGIDSGTSNGVCLVYDALGRAVEQDKGSTCPISPTSTTEIVYSPSGAKLALMNGSSLVKAFIALPGGAQAVYNSAGLQYYRHPDWLGSSRLASTSARALYYSGAYAPFGENYAQTGTQDLSFTGQNQDTESSSSGGAGGLYDFLYREHSPVQGRWLSPDPAGITAAVPADPQTWNRYAYVGNRPLQAIDALGLDCDDATKALGVIGSVVGCGCGGGGGGGFPCEFDDPLCFEPYCPPDDPSCGGGGGFPGSPPSSGPGVPGRTGGVWPGNETTGLPVGLGTSPLSNLQNLLGLLPGINCGGIGSGTGFIGATPSSSDPCPPDFSVLPVLSTTAGESSDNKNPKPQCSGGPRNAPGIIDWCKANGWVTVQGFDCSGDNACCASKLSNFRGSCDARNDWYDKKAGVKRYVVEDHSSYLSFDADCCKKW